MVRKNFKVQLHTEVNATGLSGCLDDPEADSTQMLAHNPRQLKHRHLRLAEHG